jgi:hypothetical protein
VPAAAPTRRNHRRCAASPASPVPRCRPLSTGTSDLGIRRTRTNHRRRRRASADQTGRSGRHRGARGRELPREELDITLDGDFTASLSTTSGYRQRWHRTCLRPPTTSTGLAVQAAARARRASGWYAWITSPCQARLGQGQVDADREKGGVQSHPRRWC